MAIIVLMSIIVVPCNTLNYFRRNDDNNNTHTNNNSDRKILPIQIAPSKIIIITTIINQIIAMECTPKIMMGSILGQNHLFGYKSIVLEVGDSKTIILNQLLLYKLLTT